MSATAPRCRPLFRRVSTSSAASTSWWPTPVSRPMQSGDDGWHDVIDVNLTGVYHTIKAAIPTMIKQGAADLSC